MNSIIHSPLGGFHLMAAVLSLLFGTYILLASKGSKAHRIVGYAYASSMLATNFSAFGMYNLFGGFGSFHIAALISLFTLAAGIIPVILRKSKSWLYRHMYWMHYSVFGLYAAFVSEVATRIPLGIPFFWSVGVGTVVVMVAAAFIIKWKAEVWAQQAQKAMRHNYSKDKSFQSSTL